MLSLYNFFYRSLIKVFRKRYRYYIINLFFSNLIVTLANYVIDIDNVYVTINRRVIILVFQIDDFIKIVYFYLNLLKSLIEEVIRFLTIYIFILLKLFKALLIAFLL